MTHHARLYISTDASRVIASIRELEEPNSEIILFETTTLSIDEVRRIIQMAYQTPGAKAHRLLLIAAGAIAIEAQQAFLKILEEPPVTTRFALVLPNIAGLLPTVQSRLSLVATEHNSIIPELFLQFLSSDQKVRLDMIADIAKRKADGDYTALYDGLVAYTGQGRVPESLLRLVETSLRQLRQKGSSKKMVWEELALSVPTE